MTKLNWDKAKLRRPAEYEPQSTVISDETRDWARKRQARLGRVILRCMGCGHTGAAPKKRRARYVCSRCGSHDIRYA